MRSPNPARKLPNEGAPVTLAQLDLRDLAMEGPLVVLAPHPDDEAIGCGGLIAACADAGKSIRIHYLTDGRHSHPDSSAWPPNRIAQIREAEAMCAAGILGVAPYALHFHREVDGSLLFDSPATERVLDALHRLARLWSRLTIVAPWRGDPHPDHIAAAMIAQRVREAHAGVDILSYFVWSDRPYVSALAEARSFDVRAYSIRKRRAVQSYESQAGSLITDSRYSRTMPALDEYGLKNEIYLFSSA